MRKAILALLLIVLAALGVLVSRRPGTSEPATARKNAVRPAEENSSSLAAGEKAARDSAAAKSASLPPAATVAGGTAGDGTDSREQRIAREVAEADAEIASVDIPLRFWGKVVDQTDAPVTGVEVTFESAAYVPGGRGDMKQSTGTTVTDRAGLFSIAGIRGHALTIKSLRKPGYAAVGLDGRVYSYAQLSTQNGELYRPNAGSAVIYKMARLEKAAKLVTYEYRAEIPTDGSMRRSSTGNGLLEGAFRLQFNRGDAVDAKKTRYDWTCTIQLERGGVQRSVDEFMFLAPGEGYFEKLEIAMKASNPNWRQVADVDFFVRTASGKFGRFSAHIAGPLFADEPRARVTLTGAINPAGDRSLESPPAGGAMPPK